MQVRSALNLSSGAMSLSANQFASSRDLRYASPTEWGGHTLGSSLTTREDAMKRMLLGFALAGCLIGLPATSSAQGTDPQPTCKMCPGTYIPVSEVEAYVKKAIAERRVDQQVRDVDIGKANIGIGIVHRGKLDAPNPNSV